VPQRARAPPRASPAAPPAANGAPAAPPPAAFSLIEDEEAVLAAPSPARPAADARGAAADAAAAPTSTAGPAGARAVGEAGGAAPAGRPGEAVASGAPAVRRADGAGDEFAAPSHAPEHAQDGAPRGFGGGAAPRAASGALHGAAGAPAGPSQAGAVEASAPHSQPQHTESARSGGAEPGPDAGPAPGLAPALGGGGEEAARTGAGAGSGEAGAAAGAPRAPGGDAEAGPDLQRERSAAALPVSIAAFGPALSAERELPAAGPAGTPGPGPGAGAAAVAPSSPARGAPAAPAGAGAVRAAEAAAPEAGPAGNGGRGAAEPDSPRQQFPAVQDLAPRGASAFGAARREGLGAAAGAGRSASDEEARIAQARAPPWVLSVGARCVAAAGWRWRPRLVQLRGYSQSARRGLQSQQEARTAAAAKRRQPLFAREHCTCAQDAPSRASQLAGVAAGLGARVLPGWRSREARCRCWGKRAARSRPGGEQPGWYRTSQAWCTIPDTAGMATHWAHRVQGAPGVRVQELAELEAEVLGRVHTLGTLGEGAPGMRAQELAELEAEADAHVLAAQRSLNGGGASGGAGADAGDLEDMRRYSVPLDEPGQRAMARPAAARWPSLQALTVAGLWRSWGFGVGGLSSHPLLGFHPASRLHAGHCRGCWLGRQRRRQAAMQCSAHTRTGVLRPLHAKGLRA